jgi:hypothetical protein
MGLLKRQFWLHEVISWALTQSGALLRGNLNIDTMDVYTEERPCENTARRRLSASPGKRPQNKKPAITLSF